MIAYSVGLMTVALFFEYYLLLKPCMLCYLQRFAVILVGLIGLIGYIHNSKNIIFFKSYLGASLISVLMGIGLSIRQLYLQSLWCWLKMIVRKSLRNYVGLTRMMIISTVIIVLIAVLL